MYPSSHLHTYLVGPSGLHEPLPHSSLDVQLDGLNKARRKSSRCSDDVTEKKPNATSPIKHKCKTYTMPNVLSETLLVIRSLQACILWSLILGTCLQLKTIKIYKKLISMNQVYFRPLVARVLRLLLTNLNFL